VSEKAGKPGVPGEVRWYLTANVPSVPYLEAALLLRAEPTASWDATGLARRLYVRQRDAAELLQTLRSAGLVMPAGGAAFRYTDDAELRKLMDAVAHAYAANLLEVTDLIHAKLDKRARVFADAFKLRKD